MSKYLFLLFLLFPLVSNAAVQVSWKSVINGAVAPTQTATGAAATASFGNWQVAQPGGTYYVDMVGGVGANNFSEVMYMPGCNGSLITFSGNIADKSTIPGALGELYYCQNGTPDPNKCNLISADINDISIGPDKYKFTGDPGVEAADIDTLGDDNRAWIEDIPFPFVYARWQTDPGGGVTSRWLLTCKK